MTDGPLAGWASWASTTPTCAVPPVRGGGNQAFHTGSVFAVVGTLTAVLQRDVSGCGQHVDVSLHAASNVTTEAGSYQWLVAGATVQRQTGRHASVEPTMPAQIQAADGRWITTGFPPRHEHELRALVAWMDELGLRESFDGLFFLELGIERGGVQDRGIPVGIVYAAEEIEARRRSRVTDGRQTTICDPRSFEAASACPYQ